MALYELKSRSYTPPCVIKEINFIMNIILRQKELLKNVTKTSSCSEKTSINKVGDGESLSIRIHFVLGFPFSFV